MHAPRGGAADQKSGVATEPPNLFKQVRRDVEKRLAVLGAGIEHRRRDAPVFRLDPIEKRFDRGFVADVRGADMSASAAAVLVDAFGQRFQALALA